MATLHAIGIIPARYASGRLPGKPLASIAGKPMVWHVLERARRAKRLERVVVATDDERIRDAVENRGGEVVMTAADHTSGTDRVAEVARQIESDVVLNIQGDEPLLEPGDLDRLVEALESEPEARIATLRSQATAEEYADPNAVKVVCDASGRALYFSRAPIPHRHRETRGPRWVHIGIYAFRRADLLDFAGLEPTDLELAEGLEQLRALQNGWRVQVLPAEGRFLGVDTPEDLERAREVLGQAASR